MKTYSIPLVVLILLLSACHQNSNRQVQHADQADSLQIKSASEVEATEGFHLEQVPVSTSQLGEFPYLLAPSGYRHAGEKTKSLEEKYFFYNDSLVRKVRGEYHYTAVFQDGDSFEDTYLVNEYQKAIADLGGVEFYSGRLPASAFELLDKEQPAYAADMYDPRPYKYKHFLIRTPEANIWIELCHGLNANQLDLTVVKEDVLTRTRN